MNTQHLQIILGLLLIAVYILCIQNSEDYKTPTNDLVNDMAPGPGTDDEEKKGPILNFTPN